MTITQQQLKLVLEYDPLTGEFHWVRTTSNRSRIGAKAGCKRPDGRVVISIDGVRLSAHRLAWLFVYGSLPKWEIDHINGNPSDNRIANLRDVSRADNQRNIRRPHKDNKSGFLGVSRDGNKWAATIRFDGKTRFIGNFETPEHAHDAYVKAKRIHHDTCTL